jgi:ABC-type branched-subunit amino acid transport system ATPase component
MRSCAMPRSSALIWAMTMLEIDGLDHSYGRHRALQHVSIRVGDGEVVAILGANGAGKTTLLNAATGLLRPSSGSIRFRGKELVGLRPHEIVELGIASVTETRHLFGPLSVTDNLLLGAYSPRAREAAPATIARVLELFPRLAERRRQAVRTMSGGEQQMVAVGRALMAQPALLLLDEPSLGLAPMLASELFAALTRIAPESGTSILMVEQNARRALKMANRGYLLALGRIVGQGAAQSLAKDKAVADSYLGL